MFVEKQTFQAMHESNGDGDNIVFQVFDPNGEVHGRQTFSWLLELPEAKDFTRVGSMLDAIRIQGKFQIHCRFTSHFPDRKS